MSRSRELWIDSIKVFACILVAVGHFFQSMTNSHIISASALTVWFNNTIYYFHVPLFFVCSGYLYQKYSHVASVSSWKNNLVRKSITLGIPYFAFSIVTWLLKAVFSGSVNIENVGLVETLLFAPASPYWYLYILFFVFLVTPTFESRKMGMIVFAASVLLKLISVVVGELPIYALSKLMANEVWFVGGMLLAQAKPQKNVLARWGLPVGCVLAAAFVVLSIWVYQITAAMPVIAFLMGILGCVATVLIMSSVFSQERRYPVWEFMARYTMPVFLMHTIFAAGLRGVLLKLGVANGAVHIVVGLVISFVGPIVAAEIMGKVKFLDVFLNPGKYIKLGKKALKQEIK